MWIINETVEIDIRWDAVECSRETDMVEDAGIPKKVLAVLAIEYRTCDIGGVCSSFQKRFLG